MWFVFRLGMWFVFRLLMALWIIFKFGLHWGGYVHIILIAAIVILVVELIAQRNARYHKSVNGEIHSGPVSTTSPQA